MLHKPQPAFIREKAKGIRSTRNRILLTAGLLAGMSSAMAAAPHYSLLAVSEPADAGTFHTNPETIILGQDGYIYGVSTGGGYYGQGGIFYIPPGSGINSMIDFGSAIPGIGRIIPPGYPDNNFTPMALKPNGEIVIVNNTGGNDPIAGSASGVAYVSASASGANAGAYAKLHMFIADYGDVTGPQDIAVGSDGNYYGLAVGGTSTSVSDLFKLTPDGQLTTLVSFDNAVARNFVLDPTDNMYVAMPKGADVPVSSSSSSYTSTGEILYKVTPGGTESVMHTLDPGTDGEGIDELVGDGNGNLFGAALNGGSGSNSDGSANGYGTVFELTASGTFKVLHRFTNLVDDIEEGSWPDSLVAASDGNVYGMTRVGGVLPASNTPGNGTLFRVTPSGQYTVLHTFGDPVQEGGNARSLVQAGPRTFYGVVDGGPNGTGAIFKLVVPIQDDLHGSGTSSLIMSGSGALNIGTPSDAGTTTAIASGYYVAAVADLNGDGIADLVWTSARHDLYVWFGGDQGFQTKFAGTYPDGWVLEGAGDVNGDGKDDLIWLNDQKHQFAYWLMDGSKRVGSDIKNIAAGYYPAAMGDFDRNGKLDIIWTSAKHDLYVWLGKGSDFTSKYIASYPASWRIVGRGDLNGDGRDDLIWSTTDGQQWGYWIMDGATTKKIDVLNVPAALNGYHIVASSDYNGDGRVDLVWSNGSNAVTWMNDGVCSDTVSCTFSTPGTPLTLPSNQPIFNSSLPSPLQVNR